jgi:ABC-type branched-subunit amino acid transport system substrate-binding protein
MRGVEIAVDELNEAGGILGGRPLELVMADSAEDVTEGIKAYEYLNEAKKVDFIISGCVDDVSLAWMPRLAEYKTPTLDTWTSAIRAIEMVRDEYEKYKSYFVCNNDYQMGIGMIDFAQTILVEKMGWKTCVLFQEDTAYAAGVAEFVVAELMPSAGIEILDHIVYDVETVDYTPLYSKIVDIDPDFIYTISSVNSLVPAAQYVKLQIPIPITGLSAAAIGADFWQDTGGMGAGISTFSPPPPVLGAELDPRSQEFINKYKERYTSRPILPHFNGLHGYYGVYQMVEAAERAGGFEPLDAWVREMEKTDFKLYKDGELWFRWAYYEPGEVEPMTGLTFPHSIEFELTGEEAMPCMQGVQWYPDGTAKVMYPPKFATGEFITPLWIK